MALYTGLRLPQVFGKVLSQSGAFTLPEHQFIVMDLVRYLPGPNIEVFMDVGKYENLLEGNRELFALMMEHRYKVKYHEFSGAHNHTSWSNDIWRGLEGLFHPQ